MQRHRTASEIYKKQNTLLHRAFTRCGMPYQANREDWLSLIREIAGREAGGLSELSLWERHSLINHFRRQGQEIWAPAVPLKLRGWKKGDPEETDTFQEADDRQVRMVEAMWTEMGYQLKTLRGLCWKLFKAQDPRWLAPDQLSRLVNVVKHKAEGKGLGFYYR